MKPPENLSQVNRQSTLIKINGDTAKSIYCYMTECWKFTDVLEEHTASICRVKEYAKQASKL
jgi:hypothetical protein